MDSYSVLKIKISIGLFWNTSDKQWPAVAITLELIITPPQKTLAVKVGKSQKVYYFTFVPILEKHNQITPARTLSVSGLKSRVLKLPFWLKNDGEKWYRIFYFENQRAPSEINTKLPGQFSLSWQMFLHWAAVILKGLAEFQNKKF